MSRTTFIYALCEPGTRTVRYIGKSNAPRKRFSYHLSCSVKDKTPLGGWLRSLAERVNKPTMVILKEVPYEDWEIAEERYIRLARGCKMNLLNVGNGGEGVTITPEVRQKMRDAQKGKKKAPFTRAHRAAIGAANTGSKHGMFGGTHTPEASEAISIGLQGQKRAGSSSFFSGVFWNSEKRKWEARIGCGGVRCKLGRFEDEIDAALAYDVAAIELFGASAKTNFPIKRRD